MSLHGGVDGGGTRTRAVVIDERGTIVARGEGAAGIVDGRDPAAAARAVEAVLRRVLHDAGLQPPLASLCCGLAGAGRNTEREAVRVALELAGIADRAQVTGDADVALHDAFCSGPGVLVIGGTGSIAYARTREGSLIRIGGWGSLLGDEGSAWFIGVEGLRAVLRAHDGREPETSLHDPLLRATAARDPNDLVAWSAGASKAQIAALARDVLRCAGEGDAAACRIREHAGDLLAGLVVAAARQAELSEPEVALTGALLEPGGPLRDDVARRIREQLPQVQLLQRSVDAARGAALMTIPSTFTFPFQLP